MELVETIENLNETASSKEEKRIFRTKNLEYNTYQEIKNRYYNQPFEDSYISSINELGFQSYITLCFKLVFKTEGVKEDFILFTNNIQIRNREEVDYTTFESEDEEHREKIINDLIQKHHNKAFLELEMIIKYYKFLSLDRIDYDDESEDDYESEEEYYDYLPTLELPFLHDICSICLNNKPQILLLPCLHICHCIICDKQGLINRCPVCREKIERKIIIKK